MSTYPPAQSSSDPPARTLSDEAIDLATYRITEKVSEKFNKRIAFWLSVVGVALALLGFFGISAFKSSVIRGVEEGVNANIEREIKPLTDRALTDLANNEVLSKEIQKQSLDAQGKLDTVDKAAIKMAELSANSAKLDRAFKALNERLTLASNKALQDIKSLRAAQLALSAGRPSIVSWEFTPKAATNSVIQGANFGEGPGTISVRVAYRHELTSDATYLTPLNFTGWIPIDSKSIVKWSDTMIILQFSDAFLEKYRAEVAKLKLGADSPAKVPPEDSYYQIVAKTGGVNETR